MKLCLTKRCLAQAFEGRTRSGSFVPPAGPSRFRGTAWETAHALAGWHFGHTKCCESKSNIIRSFLTHRRQTVDMSDSASRSADASDVSGSSRLPSTIEKSHLADSGNGSFTSSDRELSAGGGDHSRESPQPQPVHHTSAPLQDRLVHATADLASLAENDDRSR